MSASWENWSGGVKARPVAVKAVESVEDLKATVATAEKVRVAGSGHSFTPLVETDGTIISLEKVSGLAGVDKQAGHAAVAAGTTIRDLGPLLHEHGLALPNQGDIDRQAIAGAIGTGTHGTGVTLGSVSTAVAGFRLVTATGEEIACSPKENAEIFEAGRVSMGSLGIMSEITLACRPSYVLEETGGRMPIEEVFAETERLAAENRHFEFFWFPFAEDGLVKILRETDRTATRWDRPPDGTDSEDDVGLRAICEACIEQPEQTAELQRAVTELAGPRYAPAPDREPKARWSFEAFPSDRNVRFNEMEYAVPAERALDCVREVAEAMRTKGGPFVFPIEFRYIAADDIWLSPFYGRPSASISVHQYHKQSYTQLFDTAEEVFDLYDGRPHWGKLHSKTRADFDRLYPRFGDYCRLRAELDPQGKFLNRHLSDIFGAV